MAARVVPEGAAGDNPAEQAVVDALAGQLPDGAYVLRNLALINRRGDREADAVVVWPGVGVAVIEVKGGHPEYADGSWWLGGPGKRYRVHPVKQATECMHRIRKFLPQHPHWQGRAPRMIHHVAFPFMTLPDGFGVAECAREHVTDQTDLPTIAEQLRRRLDLLETDAPVSFDGRRLVQALTGPRKPQADMATVLDADLAERRHHADVLTARQAESLEMFRRQSRVRVLGGAGTGKTFLALEQARRLAADRQRVALVCYSRGLAEWLSRVVEQYPMEERPALVDTFHGLCQYYGAPKQRHRDHDQWEQELPGETLPFAKKLGHAAKFDVAVVDEAQDFGHDWWPLIEMGLREPGVGRLIVFADEGQAIFDRGTVPDEGFSTVVLDRNLRNTEQIARAFDRFGVHPVTPGGWSGPDVRWAGGGPGDALGLADRAVSGLRTQGWRDRNIMVLTTGKAHPVQRQRKNGDLKGYWNRFWDRDEVFYGTVQGTKGLERRAVVLAVNGLYGRRQRELCYVGMSRATDLLVVCGSIR